MSSPQILKEPSGAAPSPVRVYGQYVLVRKLAEGGMAEIFLAKKKGAEGFERNVVIKRMLPHLSEVADFVKMFHDEARLAARLSHQNIVQIDDYGFADGCYYICMEHLAGEDFSTTLRFAGRRREYVPLNIVLRVLIEAAHGLHYAHEFADETGKPLQIVHRDVSPSNVYLTYQGQVKLLDFGIAKAEEKSRETRTSTGVVKGKYIYMAPEQATGGAVDRRADVFSLGVSLYEALTNVRPFARDNDLAVLNSLLSGEFEPPRMLRRDLHPELEAVVLRAMALKPEDRYPTAAAFAADLERFLGSALSATGSSQLGSYLRSLFGEERYQERTRIPTLASLAASGYSVESGAGEPRAAELKTSAMEAVESPTAVVGSPLSVVKGRSRLRWALIAGGMILAAGLGGYSALRSVSSPGPGVAAAAPAPPVRAPSPPPVSPAAETLAEPGRTQGATPAPVAPAALAPERPRPASTARRPRAERITLTAEDIERVVASDRRGALTCFDNFKADLPADAGLVPVQFTILGSGRVSVARTQGPLADSRVGKCLEERVRRLRFPPHKDGELSVQQPFAYRVTR